MHGSAKALVVGPILVGLAACSAGGSPTNGASTSTTPAASASVASSPADLPSVQTVDAAGATTLTVDGGMDWVALAGGSAWLSNDSLVRLDGRTGREISRTALTGPTCLAPDVGFGALWVGVCSAPAQVLKVDPATGKVLSVTTLPASESLQEESSVAAGAGSVWVLTPTYQLVEISPTSGKIVTTAAAPTGSSAVRATDDALWVTNSVGNTLARLDPRDLRPVATIEVGEGPRFLAVGAGAVWTLDQASGTVTRVDPATNSVVATVRVDEGAIQGGDIAVGGGFVWARVTDSLVAKIDPSTNTVVARYGPPGGSGSVAADPSAAWITAHDSDSVYRLPLAG